MYVQLVRVQLANQYTFSCSFLLLSSSPPLQEHEGVCNYPNDACRKKRDIICKGCQKILGSWDVYAELFKGPEVQTLWEEANYEDESLGPVDRERSRPPHRRCRRQTANIPQRLEAECATRISRDALFEAECAKQISTNALFEELRSRIPEMDGRPGHPHR